MSLCVPVNRTTTCTVFNSLDELLTLAGELDLHIIEEVSSEDVKVVSVHSLTVGGNAIAAEVTFARTPNATCVEINYVGKPFWIYKIVNKDDECTFSLEDDPEQQLKQKLTPMRERDLTAYLSMHFNVINPTSIFATRDPRQRTFINVDKPRHKAMPGPPMRLVRGPYEGNKAPLYEPKKETKPFDEDCNHNPFITLRKPWLTNDDDGEEDSPPPLVSSDSEEETESDDDDEEDDADSNAPNGMFIGRKFTIDLMNCEATATVAFISDEAVIAELKVANACTEGNTATFRLDVRMRHVNHERPLTDASNMWIAEIDPMSAKAFNAFTGKKLPMLLPMTDTGEKAGSPTALFTGRKTFQLVGPENTKVRGHIDKNECTGWIIDDENRIVNFKAILRPDQGVGVHVADNKMIGVCLFIRDHLVATA